MLSFTHGLMQHWLVKSQIHRLGGSEREIAESEFYSLGKSKHLLAGTLAKIDSHSESGVEVWTDRGLFFPTLLCIKNINSIS